MSRAGFPAITNCWPIRVVQVKFAFDGWLIKTLPLCFTTAFQYSRHVAWTDTASKFKLVNAYFELICADVTVPVIPCIRHEKSSPNGSVKFPFKEKLEILS